MVNFVRRFGEILGVVSLPRPIDLHKNEQPVVLVDTLQPISTTRTVTESLGVTGAVAGVGGALLVLAPPVGAAIIAGGAIVSALSGLFWGVRRYIVSKNEGNLQRCLRQYHELREQIGAANVEELKALRQDLGQVRRDFQEAGLYSLYHAVDLLSLEHLVDHYQRAVGGALRAAAEVNQTAPTPHAAEGLIQSLRDYKSNSCAQNKANLVACETGLSLHIARASYESLHRASDALAEVRGTFEDCGCQEMYFIARKSVLAKMAKRLDSHSFAMTDLHDNAVTSSDDEDINF